MPLQLSITDTTGSPSNPVVYPNSYHVITEVHTKGLSQTCQLKIQVWVDSAAYAAQATPIKYNGWIQDFYLIDCTQAEFTAIAVTTPVVSGEVGTPVRNPLIRSAYAWLAAQTSARTGYFDYTTATIV